MEDSDQRSQRLAKLAALRQQGIDPFAIERFACTHAPAQIVDGFDALDGKPVSVAGRIDSLRRMGGSIFAHIRDATGRIQMYVRRDVVGQEAFDRIRTYDLSDIVGVEGTVMRTNTGEVSVRAACMTLLAKALRPLPMGHEVGGELHGTMTDPELRHRMRYVDFAVNPWTRDLIVRRSRMVTAIRRFLDERGFLEVETPVLQAVAGGAAARPFVTHHNALDRDYKLRIALELSLKRLVVGGFDRVYEVGRVFRNEGIDTSHNPEFSLLELYQAYTDLDGMMDLVEDLYTAACVAVNGEPRFRFTVAKPDGSVEEQMVDLSVRPWRRLPMLDGIERYAGVRREELCSLESARAVCARLDIPPEKEHTVGGIIEKLHEVYTQPQLVQPTFITDFPAETSPLAKKCPTNGDLTRRFEVYMGTQELGNAFSEINDPLDQRERFEMQTRQLAAGNEEAHPMDEDFLRALEYGMPPTGGFGGGIDRLIMVFAGVRSIREVIAFPLLRPEA